MALSPRFWYWIAVLGSLLNVGGFAFAAAAAEPWHATAHAGLAVAFAAWAQHLKARFRAAVPDRENELEVLALRDEVAALRGELSLLQERLDFVERVLSQARELDRLPNRHPGEGS